jgi:hypothetical protein
MKDDDPERKAHAALQAALDRVDLLRRKLTCWEVDCLSKVLTAISQGKYRLAQNMVNCSLVPPLDDWQPPANATDPSLAKLRADLDGLGGNSGPIFLEAVADGPRRQRR